MKGLVILSGGIDSTTALYAMVRKEELEEVEALTFNYGSKHNEREIEKAKITTEKLGIKHTIIDIPFINEHFRSSLLKSGPEINNGDYSESNMKDTVVPFRNGIMLSIAAGFAESIKASVIIIGNHSGDHSIYPDCREAFISSMSQAIEHGTYGEIEILSPFCNMSKSDICKLGIELGVDYADTYSCYKGEEKECGECSTCKESISAFISTQRKPDSNRGLEKASKEEILASSWTKKYKSLKCH